jgi:VanZ family protein
VIESQIILRPLEVLLDSWALRMAIETGAMADQGIPMPTHSRLRAHKQWLPVALWMGFIFVMSSDFGSGAHTSLLLEPLIFWIKPNASPEDIERVHFLVRKFAHLSEYAVLALLLLRAIKLSLRPTARRWSWQRAAVALLIAATYAATDEWHQSFVPSRTADLKDVLIDSSGALIGLMLVFFWCKLTSLGWFFPTRTPPQVGGIGKDRS